MLVKTPILNEAMTTYISCMRRLLLLIKETIAEKSNNAKEIIAVM